MSIPAFKAGKLGKLPRKIHAKTLFFGKYSTSILPYLKPAIAWEKKVPTWNMYMNDQIGDCVIAAIGHVIMTMTSQTGILATPSDAQIEQVYSAITGYVPGNLWTDKGTIMVDALDYWRTNGIAGHKILGWAAIKITPSLAELRQAISLFGSVLVGFEFPQSAMDQFNHGDPWSVNMASPLIGGHCVPISEYDPTRLVCETWGALQPLSLGFLPYYCDEAYAVITQDWINQATKRSPSGFNIDVLKGDLAVLNNG